MKIKVRMFLGEKEILPKELDKLVINSKHIDRVVNAVYEQNAKHPENMTEPTPTL